jgi:hypothetical protein
VGGPSRSVEFDLLVSGTEVGGRKLERLADKVDDVTNSVKKLDGTTARIRGVARLEKDSDGLADTMRSLAGRVGSAAAGVVKFASYLGLAAGAVGPLAIGLGVATAAIAKFAVEMSGAALALLPLAAGAAFVKLTFKGMGEQWKKSVEPITEGWKEQTAAVGELATKGIRPLAKEFVRANFPAIAAAQERIGRATNKVVIGFGKWLNSSAGVRVIKTLTGDTATAFEKLAPAVRSVGQSLLMLAARVSGVSFGTFTEQARRALNMLNGWIDTLGKDDVERGFKRIGDAARAVADGFRAISNAVKFVDENRQKILALSDAILGLTIVGAALTGGWIVAIGASLILLARHWNDVTAAVTNAKNTIADLPNRFTSLQGTLDSFSDAWAAVSEGFREVADRVGPRIQPMLQRVQDAFIRAQPLIAGVTTVLGGFIKALLQIAGPAIAGAVDAIGLFAESMGHAAFGAAMAAEQILAAFVALVQPLATLAKKLKLPFADAFQSFVDGAGRAKDRINSSMSQVKTDLARTEIQRLQVKVNSLKGKTVKTEADRRAIALSEARIRDLQRTINSLRGKTVHSYVITHQMLDPGHRAGERRAAGGPVQAGRPYIVGEKRPELFVPRQSGRIVPSVPAGWNGGGGGRAMAPTTLVLQSSGSRVDDMLVEIIRRSVRVKGGGNVQVALGR